MIPIKLPVTPNAPIVENGNQIEGDFQLKAFGSFGFFQNILYESSLLKYDENYQNEVVHSKFFKNHLCSVYSIMKSHFPNGGKLVEVGCGKGAFLDIVKSDNHFEYAGYDNAYEGDDALIHSRYLTKTDRIDADIIVLRHTLEHIESPHKFLRLLNTIFGNSALIFIEVPQFDWIDKGKVIFDLSYEHVNYFTANSLCSLFSCVIDFGDFFEGQYQYCLAELGALSEENWIEFDVASKWCDVDIEEYYQKFYSSVDFLSTKKNIWVWGGASKGVLFLMHLSNLCPSIFKKVVGVVDINPKKQSLFTPSTNIQIISDNQMFEESEEGDVVLVMNPNYHDEIKDIIAVGTSHNIEVYNI